MHHPSPRLGMQLDERHSVLSTTSSAGSSTLLLDSASQRAQKTATGNAAAVQQQNLRKFTSAVGKPGQARETREAISKVLSAVNPMRSAPLAEPLDYERFVTEKSAQLEHDRDRDLLLFLRDDISGTEMFARERTAVPSVRQSDIDEAKWLLAKDALRHYASPQTVINLNYTRFGGDFKKMDPPQTLNYLRFESDLVAEEEKMQLSCSGMASDVLKEGSLMVVPGDGLVDTFRSEKKRFCVLRRSPVSGDESGVHRVYIEVYKQQQGVGAQQLPSMEMEIKSASLKSTKKGKLLQLFSPESDKRSGSLLLSAEIEAELQFWLFEIERALTWNSRGEMFASEDTISLNSSGRENSLPPSSMHDSESLASEESAGSRDSSSAFWRSRNAAAKALQPPIVERRNVFSLYWDMESLPEPEGEKSTMGEPLSEMEQCNVEWSLPIPKRSPSLHNNNSTPGSGSKQRTTPSSNQKRIAPMAPSEESPVKNGRNGSQSPEQQPSSAEFVGEKPAILFTATVKQLELRARLAGREQPEQIEPFFARLFLFDAGLGMRISEEFQVDFPCAKGALPLTQSDSPSTYSIASQQSLKQRQWMAAVNGISRELISGARKLICAIRNPRPDLFLVAYIERTLSDVPADLLYGKPNSTMDTKTTAKVQKSLCASLQRLGHLRTLFAWTARPVFPSLCIGGVFASQQQQQKCTVCPLYKCEGGRMTDADLQKVLGDMQRGEKAAKLASLPGAHIGLEADVTSVLCEFPMRISPSFLPLRPWRRPSTPEQPPCPSFELQSFLEQALNAEPHRSLVNLLYVYPLSLNYSSQKAFARARNIACTVRYVPSSAISAVADDDTPAVLPHIFHRTHPSGPFMEAFACSVQYHEQNPLFNNEVKLRLPTALEDSDHLLFTFHHVSVANAVANKPSAENIESPVGYAWLPLTRRDERGLAYLAMTANSQEFELPVAANLPTNYIDQSSKENSIGSGSSGADVKFLENKRPLFRVRMRLISSVFCTEERVQKFFQMCQHIYPQTLRGSGATSLTSEQHSPKRANGTAATYTGSNIGATNCSASDTQSANTPTHQQQSAAESHLTEAIASLTGVDIDLLLPFLEPVLNRLFSLPTISKSADVAIAALSAIVHLSNVLFTHRKSKRDILRNYVRLHFRGWVTDEAEEETTHWAICKYTPMLIQRLENGVNGKEQIARLFRQLWLLLDCAAKSMAHWLIVNNALKAPRRGRLPSDLYFCLEELFHTLTRQIVLKHRDCSAECRAANVAMANFLKHCLSLMDRHMVMKELYSIVKRMDSVDSRAFRIYKLELLQILAGHEHWIPLCLPVLADRNEVVMRGDSLRLESLSTTTQNSSPQQSKGSGGFLSKLFSQIFSPFHGIISESSDVERYSAYSEHFHLSATYCGVHFPIGLLFQELVASLRDSRDYRRRVIRLVCNLLAKHSRDERYGDTSARNRIAILNVPLLRLTIENIRELEIAAKSISAESPCLSPIPQIAAKGDTYRNRSSMFSTGAEWQSTIGSERMSVVSTGTYCSAPTKSTTATLQSETNNSSRQTQKEVQQPPMIVMLAEKLDKLELREVVLSALYILNGLPKKMLAAFWNAQEQLAYCGQSGNGKQQEEVQQQSNAQLDFIRLLELSLAIFRYRGRTHHIVLQAKRIKALGRANVVNFTQKSTNYETKSNGKESQFSTLTDFISDSNGAKTLGNGDEEARSGRDGSTSFLMDCNMAQEVALIVLETVQTLSNQLAAKTRYSSSDSYDAIFVRLLHLELELLSECWPEAVRLHSLAALAVFVNLFSARFFHSGPLDCLSTLIRALLLQLNSRIVKIQNAAAALVHLLLRSGYDTATTLTSGSSSKPPTEFPSCPPSFGGEPQPKLFLTERLGRPGAQISPVLARLLSEKAILDNYRFERGLSALESLVSGNKQLSNPSGTGTATSIQLTSLFDRAVLELVKQLRGVLEATQAIADTINDPIQLADLHIQLANSYRGSAALRSEFFDALASSHLAGAWYSEAAVCQAHSLAIIGKELLGRRLISPDWSLLGMLNEQIAKEEGVLEDNQGSTQQGGFTIEDFTRKVEEIVRTLLLAERYEAVGPLCRMVIPVFEQQFDFKALVGIYAEIQQACSRAAEVKASGKRHLGSYFKVTFIGQQHFGAEHKTEWVYREPRLTSLAEACDRIVESVRLAMGHDRVQILSERVEPDDPVTAFVQVAHVEPSRPSQRTKEKQRQLIKEENGDKAEDPMNYRLHTNVHTFIQEERMVDPYAMKDATELARTALRRLTLTVENCFPGTRRRQRVVRTEERVLSPLELACESLLFKTAQIRRILMAADIPRGLPHIGGYDKSALNRLDLKQLQLFLQGSVSPSVNAGLLAYAETFTAPAQQQRYGKEGIAQLMNALKTLIGELNEALRVNEAAMGGERSEYQQMLRQSFDGMLERLPTFFGGEKFLTDHYMENKANAAQLNSVLDRLNNIGGTAAEMHIFDSISGLNT